MIRPIVKRETARPSAKVPNAVLSGKGCVASKTTRMLAQKQPPFKECVIAHWSRSHAPKIPGAKVQNRSYGFISNDEW